MNWAFISCIQAFQQRQVTNSTHMKLDLLFLEISNRINEQRYTLGRINPPQIPEFQWIVIDRFDKGFSIVGVVDYFSIFYVLEISKFQMSFQYVAADTNYRYRMT